MKENKHRWDKIPPVILKPGDIDLSRTFSTFAQAGEILKMEENSVNKSCGKLRKKLGGEQ